MALYYDLGPLYKVYKDDEQLVREKLVAFVDEAKQCLKKMKEGIEEKKYNKVKKHLEILMPSLEFLGVDAVLDEAKNIEKWIHQQGKTKEVKEIFKSFKSGVKSAVKELKKDFSL